MSETEATATADPDEEVEVDEEEEVLDVGEIAPLIYVGNWARVKANATGVPRSSKGRDVVVLRAPLRVGGLDSVSSERYHYQESDDVFLVKLRDTGEEFECTRAAFAAFGAERTHLGGKP